MGSFFVAGVLILTISLFWTGEILQGCACLAGLYGALMVYNRFNGDGVPTFTFEQCKEEWEEKKRGK